MCGRYALAASQDELVAELGREYFDGINNQNDNNNNNNNSGNTQSEAEVGAGGVGDDASGSREKKKQLDWKNNAQSAYYPRYNISPTSKCVVIRRTDQVELPYNLEIMKWGLLPAWLKDPPTTPLNTINARDDKVSDGSARMWATLRSTRRCVVVAQGFYEWKVLGNAKKTKMPHFTKREDGKLLIMAGMWDETTYNGQFEPIRSFTIITTDSNKQLRFLHDRMPAVLENADEIKLWLSAEPWSKKIQNLLRPYEGVLEVYPVPTEVGSVKNDSPSMIVPLDQQAGNIASMFAKQASASPSKPITSKATFSDPSAFASSSKMTMFSQSRSPDLSPDQDKVESKTKRPMEVLVLSDSDTEDPTSSGTNSKGIITKKSTKKPKKLKKTKEGDVKINDFFKKG